MVHVAWSRRSASVSVAVVIGHPLDAIFRGLFPDAVNGDVRAAEGCLKVMERRARLLNLDAAHAAGLEHVESLLDRLVLGSED